MTSSRRVHSTELTHRTKRTVLLVAGTGFVGKALMRALISRGDLVTITSRTPSALPSPLKTIVWDPNKDALPSGALDGIDVVINLAGAAIAPSRWTTARKQLLRDSRIVTTEHLATAILATSHPPMLINASAVGYYPPSATPFDEFSPPGDDFLGKLCVDWEAAAVRAAEKARVIVLRSGVVLGTDGGSYPLMALPIRFAGGGAVGNGDQWVPWIHISDEVALILHVIDTPSISGPINCVSPHSVQQLEFTKTLANVLKRPSFIPIPGFFFKAALGETASVLLDSHNIVPRVALASGFTYEYPFLIKALRALEGR